MLNHNHLRLFAAAVEAGSISGAAAQLRLSQPALSKQIQELESALGIPLLERLPRGVRPTAAGELLAAYARRLYALAEEAESAVSELRDLRRGRLRLGASMTIGVYLAPRMLADYSRRWPGIAVQCAIENTDWIQRGLVEHRLDLGLTEGPGPFETELDELVFRQDELIVVAAAHFAAPSPSQPRRTWTMARLADLPWIMREPGSGTRAIVDAVLAQSATAIRPTWVFNNPEAIKQAVIAGCGVAMLPRITVENELAQRQMVQLDVRRKPGAPPWQRPLRAQWRRGRPLSPAMRAFLTLLDSSAPA